MIRYRTALLLAAALLCLPTAAAPAVIAARVTCAATATVVYANTTDSNSRRVLLLNSSADSVYVGPATLTSSTGFTVAAGAAVSVVLEASDTLYCITASGTAAVNTLVSRY